MTHTDHLPFLRRISSAPEDDAPRLVYADWLTEKDGDDKCRVCDGTGSAIESVYGFKTESVPCHRCDGRGSNPNHYAERAELIRAQCQYMQLEQQLTTLKEQGLDQCTICSARWCPECGDCTCPTPEERLDHHSCLLHAPGSPHDQYRANLRQWEQLRERSTELLKEHWLEWCFPCAKYLPLTTEYTEVFRYRRGFVATLELTAAQLLSDSRQLLEYQPIDEWLLSGRQPVQFDGPDDTMYLGPGLRHFREPPHFRGYWWWCFVEWPKVGRPVHSTHTLPQELYSFWPPVPHLRRNPRKPHPLVPYPTLFAADKALQEATNNYAHNRPTRGPR